MERLLRLLSTLSDHFLNVASRLLPSAVVGSSPSASEPRRSSIPAEASLNHHPVQAGLPSCRKIHSFNYKEIKWTIMLNAQTWIPNPESNSRVRIKLLSRNQTPDLLTLTTTPTFTASFRQYVQFLIFTRGVSVVHPARSHTDIGEQKQASWNKHKLTLKVCGLAQGTLMLMLLKSQHQVGEGVKKEVR